MPLPSSKGWAGGGGGGGGGRQGEIMVEDGGGHIDFLLINEHHADTQSPDITHRLVFPRMCAQA